MSLLNWAPRCWLLHFLLLCYALQWISGHIILNSSSRLHVYHLIRLRASLADISDRSKTRIITDDGRLNTTLPTTFSVNILCSLCINNLIWGVRGLLRGNLKSHHKHNDHRVDMPCVSILMLLGNCARRSCCCFSILCKFYTRFVSSLTNWILDYG